MGLGLAPVLTEACVVSHQAGRDSAGRDSSGGRDTNTSDGSGMGDPPAETPVTRVFQAPRSSNEVSLDKQPAMERTTRGLDRNVG